MPTINEMMEMAELLRSKSVVAIEDHCVAVRNRNSSCRRCAEACMAGAISIAKNELTIDAGACVACGVCIGVCPTAALVSLDPMDEDLAVAVASAVKQADGGMAVVSCARMASKQLGDPDKYAVVPCLGRIEESFLVSLAAHGVEDIVLVDGDCSTCKYGKASSFADVTIDAAIDLLETVGAEAIITRASEFPPEVLAKDALQVRGAARRGFFSQATGYAKNVTMTVAEKAVADALHQNQQQKLHTLRDRLGAGKSGKMPTFTADRNMRIMDALCQIGERLGTFDALMVPEEEGAAVAESAAHDAGAESAAPADAGVSPTEPSTISTRHFGVVSIDPEPCSGCGMCVMFCPTEALKYSTLEEPANEEMRYLEFQAADCTQCGLCVDVCLRKCLTLSSEVPVRELFDFEPRLIEIPRPKKPAKLFSRNH